MTWTQGPVTGGVVRDEDEPDDPATVSLSPPTAGAEDTLIRGEPPAMPGGPLSGDFPVVPKDHYEIGAEIARGGLGRILVGFDRTLNRHVAIKELLVHQGHAEERFVREALITARLEHPNIVTVHEAGRWEVGERFYAMQLVQGRTLSQAIDQARTSLARLALVPAIIDVADAVAYAHSQRVLHRDLKPANVMLGPFGETVLLDWGLAKDMSASAEVSRSADESQASASPFHTADGIVVGTPPYMPPEQAAAVGLDERSDVYSLGAMLYHVLSGVRPYEEAPDAEVLEAVVTRPPKALAKLVQDMPPELIAIADKAMSRLPEDRYDSAQEMAQELRRYSTGQLVGAHHYSAWEMVVRFTQRHFAAVVTAALALVVLVAFGAWSFQSITEQRNEALAKEQVALRNLDKSRLERARSLLDSDPTAALRVLNQVEDIAHVSPGAATVAAEAEDLGVARTIWQGHERPVDALAAGPAGIFVSSGRDGAVLRWSASSTVGEEIGRHNDRVTALAFSPDQSRVASASHDGTWGLWPVGAKGSGRRFEGHEGAVRSVDFSADGKRVATASEDKTIRVWSLDGDDVEVLHVQRADRHVMARFVGNDRLLSAGHGGRLRMWNLADGTQDTWGQVDGTPVSWIEVSPDEQWLAVGFEDGQLNLRNIQSGQTRELVGHSKGLIHLKFSPDSQKLASAGLDWVVRVWDVASASHQELVGHRGRVTQLEFSKDGALLASASWDKTVILWTLDNDARQVFRGHQDVVASLVMQDKLLVSASWDRSLRVWPVASEHSHVFEGHSVGVHAVAFSPSGEWMGSGGHDDQIRLWGKKPRVLRGHTDHVFRVVFSPDERWVASSSDDQTVRVWSVNSDEVHVLRGHQADVEELRFSPDGQLLVSAGEDHKAFVWSMKDFKGRALEAHDEAVSDLRFFSGQLWTASRDGTVRSWRLPDLKPQHVLRHPAAVNSIDVVKNRIATVSEDSVVRLWSALGEQEVSFDIPGARRVRASADGRLIAVSTQGPHLWLCFVEHEVCDPFKGHKATSWDLQFDPAGRLLVSAGADGDLRVWDVETGESRVFRGHKAPVFDLDVSADGRFIVSGSGDGTVRRWRLRGPPRPDALSAWIDERIGSN